MTERRLEKGSAGNRPAQYSMMKEDRFLLGQIEDKIAQSENKYIVTGTGFLDSHQQSLAREYCRKQGIPAGDFSSEQAWAAGEMLMPPVRTVFYGGYAEAERVVLLNLPDYAALEDYNPLTVIRAVKTEGSRVLTHRDYLGSLIGLGIKREMIGDILVRADGADILCISDIAEFILANYLKAGRTGLSLTRHTTAELMIPEVERTQITDTVASLRLDSIVASAFGLSRAKAAEAVTKGIVFVNHVETGKPDLQLCEGDRITLRGKGKACLLEVGGRSRKDRQYITIERY